MALGAVLISEIGTGRFGFFPFQVRSSDHVYSKNIRSKRAMILLGDKYQSHTPDRGVGG